MYLLNGLDLDLCTPETEADALLSKTSFTFYYSFKQSIHKCAASINFLLLVSRYWSSRRESWPKMVPQTSTVSKIFGSRAYERYRYDLTLLEAAERNDDGDNVFARLVKQSTAALLNSYARENYPYTAWQVKTMLIQALVSEKSASILAQQLSQANEACN